MKHILATNNDGLWTQTKVGYYLPRRNGKKEIIIMSELFGIVNEDLGFQIAHRTDTSHSV